MKAALREVEGQVAETDMPLLRSLFDSGSHSTNMSPLTGLDSRTLRDVPCGKVVTYSEPEYCRRDSKCADQ